MPVIPQQIDGRPVRILIVRLSALGDVCHAVPAVSALHQAYPEARIDWVVETASAEIVRMRPDVNTVHVLPRKEWSRAAKNPLLWPKIWLSLRGFLRTLRDESYDWVIDFQGNARSAFIARGCKAPNRVGWEKGRAKEGAHRSYTVPVSGKYDTKVNEDLHLVRELGIDTDVSTSPWEIPGDARSEVDQFVGDAPFVLLHPGVSSFGSYKAWPEWRWKALLEQLGPETRILVSHGPGETELAKKVADDSAELLPDGWDLNRLAAAMLKASCVVASDTGPLHLADALGVPCVGLYGPKDPERYGISGPRSKMIYREEIPCRPCAFRSCDDPICMRWIDEEDVAAAVDTLVEI